MHRTCFGAVAVAVCAAVALPVWAVNRCTLADGRVVYQDALCPAAAAASQVRLFTPPVDPAGRQRAAAEVAAAARLTKAAQAAAAPQDAQSVGPAGVKHVPQNQAQNAPGTLAALANACLDFYRPSLRDPAGAYWSAASVDMMEVLRMTLHARNGFGGYVTKLVGCEVPKGKLDAWRTKANADRLAPTGP